MPGIQGGLKSVLAYSSRSGELPQFAKAFTRDRGVSGGLPGQTVGRRECYLWADTFNNYLHPQTSAGWRIACLPAAGFQVADFQDSISVAGGRLYDFGMLDTAKQYLLKVLDVLAPQIAVGTPIVVLEPSCATVFRDELTNLLPHDPRAVKLRAQTFLLSEFLVRFAPEYRPPRVDGKIVVHGHCHQRATMGMHDELTLLRQTGAEVELLDSGCCGMAGPFGFEHDKYEISQKLAERVLLPAVRREADRAIIVSDGFSCCEQITQNTSARPLHLAEVLAGVRAQGDVPADERRATHVYDPEID